MPVVIMLLVGLLGGLLSSAPALAQTCTADSQCAPPGMNRRATCQGSVLVTVTRLCQGGRCTDGAEQRTDCGGGVGLGACDPVAGHCRSTGGVAGTAPSVCPPRCICRGTTLIIVTGRRGQGKQRCETQVSDCAKGCVCAPTPHCKGTGRVR